MDVPSPAPSCPQCGAPLKAEEDGTFWCELNKRSFSPEEVSKNNEWHDHTVAEKITLYRALGLDEVKKRYFLQEQQVSEILRLDAESAAVVETKRELVTPEKASLISLARTVTDEEALCELIDNAIDAGKIKRPGQRVNVRIMFNEVLRTLTVEDDAGGMNREDMRRCFTLGARKLDTTAGVIGRYGIGAKEAIYHYGRSAIVRSRLKDSQYGIRTVVSEDWLNTQDWAINIEEGLRDIPEGCTSVEIGNLELTGVRDPETGERESIDRVAQFIGHTYERLIAEDVLRIDIQGRHVTEGMEYVSLYPPELYPRTYTMRCGNVDVRIKTILIGGPSDAQGMAFYAQGRRFAHIRWSDMRARMIFEKIAIPKHDQRDHVRLEIDFDGPIEEIPINATKDSIRQNPLLEIVAPVISKVVEAYFRAVPDLSHKGIGIVKAYTDEHPEAVREPEPLDLGRLSGRPIPAQNLPSYPAFRRFLSEKNPEAFPPEGMKKKKKVEPPQPPAGGTSTLTEGHKQNGEAVVEIDGDAGGVAVRTKAARLSASVTCDCDTMDKEAEVRRWIQKGISLGIDIRCQWD